MYLSKSKRGQKKEKGTGLNIPPFLSNFLFFSVFLGGWALGAAAVVRVAVGWTASSRE